MLTYLILFTLLIHIHRYCTCTNEGQNKVMEKGKKSIEECVEIARESIDSGKALATFKKFVELNS